MMRLPNDESSAAAAHAVIALATAQRLTFADEEADLGRLALGWLLRLCRSAEAALLLQGAQYKTEAAPLIRSCMQHAAALNWLESNRSSAFEIVSYQHRVYLRKLAADMATAGWELEISDDIRTAIAAPEPARPEGTGGFADFKQLCAAIDFPLLYVAYRIDSEVAHPTYLSALAYWDDDEKGFVYADSNDLQVPSVWIAAVLLIGASAFERLSPDQNFREGILAIDRSLGLGLLKELEEDPSTDT